MCVDTFGMFDAVRPGGRVAALEELIIELGDVAGFGLSGAPHDWLDAGERILCCFKKNPPPLYFPDLDRSWWQLRSVCRR